MVGALRRVLQDALDADIEGLEDASTTAGDEVGGDGGIMVGKPGTKCFRSMR